VAVIRPYRTSDRPAVYDICIRTADAGHDATDSYEDPGILPAIFAGPYVALEPELAFVVADDDDHAVGYIIGTADTAAFARRFSTDWLPTVADRYPRLDRDPVTPDEIMRDLLYQPERMVVPALAAYPAHLHIDVLPAFQGSGHGRALVTRFVGALRQAAVPALHLGMLTSNRPARAFYDRLGFHVIDVPDAGPVTYLGLHTGA
jgi:ribosomal protein S18 acetylase RimI-like enzyme